jgi:hypothetical protein
VDAKGHKHQGLYRMGIGIENISILQIQIIHQAANGKQKNENGNEFFYHPVFNDLKKEEGKKYGFYRRVEMKENKIGNAMVREHGRDHIHTKGCGKIIAKYFKCFV